MTPAARVAAAIGLLDEILAGEAAEKLLTTWARKNRYAGSGDRAAIRDHVYDALRCRRSFAWLGGAVNGRGLMIGGLRAAGRDPAEFFTGERFAPAPLLPDKAVLRDLSDAPRGVRLDLPDWLLPDIEAALGDDLEPVADRMRHRAPVFLRVNTARTSRGAAAVALAAEGIGTAPHPLAKTALRVTENRRRVQASAAWRDGLVELQDAASQAVVETLPRAERVLDYCAGGGGKALALAARGGRVFAHDADPARMRDIPPRAARASARISVLSPDALAAESRFDLVLCDAPCSGSGTWARTPEAKWRLTRAALDVLLQVQGEILDVAQRFVAPGGSLAYATCSLLQAENEAQVAAFLARHPNWRLTVQRRFSPLEGGDGFYVAHLTRAG